MPSILWFGFVALAVLGVASALPRPLAPRRYVAVPVEDVHLIREVRQAQHHRPAETAPPTRPARQHSNHRYPPVEEQGPYRYEEPVPQSSGYEDVEQAAQTVYEHEDQPRNRFERQSGGGGGDDHEYVDYGAHTGHHGAFGWYADFPVISKGHR